MNPIQLHMLVNHAPLFAAFFGVVLGVAGYFSKNRGLMVAAMLTLILGALIAMVANGSGEEAEELVEHLPGVSHKLIHEHEEAAEFALYASIAVGVLALLSLVGLARKIAKARAYVLITSLAAIASFVSMAKTAHEGGKIMHHELPSGSLENALEGSDKEIILGD
jgi:uncharacterized membrane protein